MKRDDWKPNRRLQSPAGREAGTTGSIDPKMLWFIRHK
jgi:hypothetical protein